MRKQNETFDSSCGAVRVELLSEFRVLLLELLQVLRQTMYCGVQRFLLPLGTFTLRSTTVDAKREGGFSLESFGLSSPCGHPGAATTSLVSPLRKKGHL